MTIIYLVHIHLRWPTVTQRASLMPFIVISAVSVSLTEAYLVKYFNLKHDIPFNLSTMVSTLICRELTRKSSTHRGCRIPLRKKRDSVPTRSRPSRSKGHRWRRWTGQETPGTCTRSRTGTTGRCCRGYLSACPAASPGAGPRRSGAYSPGGGSAAPRPPWGRCRDRWTRTCERRACTGCSRRRSARRPPGSRHPLLGRDGQTSRLALKLSTATVTVHSDWLPGDARAHL